MMGRSVQKEFSNLGVVLHDYMVDHNLVYEDLANRLSVNKMSVYNWVVGDLCPRPNKLPEIAELTGKSRVHISKLVIDAWVDKKVYVGLSYVLQIVRMSQGYTRKDFVKTKKLCSLTTYLRYENGFVRKRMVDDSAERVSNYLGVDVPFLNELCIRPVSELEITDDLLESMFKKAVIWSAD